eukprot:4811889-Amphidinium_carterae.1
MESVSKNEMYPQLASASPHLDQKLLEAMESVEPSLINFQHITPSAYSFMCGFRLPSQSCVPFTCHLLGTKVCSSALVSRREHQGQWECSHWRIARH